MDDKLHPTARTWIDLDPREPRLRESIARVFRALALDAKSDNERERAVALAEKWSAQP